MTRQEKLIQLVAGLGNWTPLGESWNSEEARAKYAVKQLAAIEKVCPEDEARSLEGHAFFKVQADCWRAAMDKAVAAERERCAKIADGYADDPRDPAANTATDIAAAIRRGGA